jgi:hypothetical protein
MDDYFDNGAEEQPLGKVANIDAFRLKNGNVEVRDGGYYVLPYYTESFDADPKRLKKFVKNAETLFRRSDEYTSYLAYLRSSVGMDRCAFLGNVDGDNADIEFHHYPLTLYDCAEAIAVQMALNGEMVSVPRLVDRLLEEHYADRIGGVMLSETAHQMAHSGQLFIPLSMVFGDIRAFVEKYKEGVHPKNFDKLATLVEESQRSAPHGGALAYERRTWNKSGVTPMGSEEV